MTASHVAKATLARLFHEALAATLDAHVTSHSIDMDGWLRDADRLFRKANRQILRTVEREAVEAYKHDLLLRFVRGSRDARIEHVRELTRIATVAARSQRIEQIAIRPGQYVAKRIVDCSRHELRILAQQYDTRAASMSRRAAFYRRIEQQLELAGMDDGQSIHDWLRRQERDRTGTDG